MYEGLFDKSSLTEINSMYHHYSALVEMIEIYGYESMIAFVFQGSHPCLKGNTKAMAMVTAIIGGTGSLGEAKSHI